MRTILTVLVGVAVCLGASHASAQQVGWVVSSQPSAASHTPALQDNSTGATNTVRRNGTGDYTVTLPGLAGQNGAVHVAAQASTARCKVAERWSGGNVRVRCFNGNALADSQFVALFYAEGSGPATGAYLTSNFPTQTTPYVQVGNWNWNSAGGANTITRLRQGEYKVVFARLGGETAPTGFPFVTAFGSDASSCKVARTGSLSPDVDTYVFCKDGAGRPSDTRFVLSYFRQMIAIGTTRAPQRGAGFVTYLGAAHTPSWSAHAQGVIQRRDTGRYRMSSPIVSAVSGEKSAVLVMANQQSSRDNTADVDCTTSTWHSTTGVADVHCRRGGVDADGGFTAMFLTTKYTRDLSAALQFKLVSKTSATEGTLEVLGIVKNVGAHPFSAGGGQARVVLLQINNPTGTPSPTTLAELPLTSLAAGAAATVTKQITWSTTTWTSRVPPTFQVEIRYASGELDMDRSDDAKGRNGLEINQRWPTLQPRTLF